MDNGRKRHQKVNADFRLLGSVGLAGMMAIASSSAWIGQAQTSSSSSLPKVGAEATAPETQKSSAAIDGTAKKSDSTSAASPRFFCQIWNGQYTVMYSPENRSSEAFPWAVPKDLGNGWVAEKRCNEISRRLEEYRPDGLNELSTSTENGYNIVCATTKSNPSCRIVFTVPPGQDPVTTRNSVFQNLTVADGGTMTQGVNTYVSRGNGNVNLTDNLVNLGLSVLGSTSAWSGSDADRNINLKPYLSTADGGTGVGLTNGVRIQRGPRSNQQGLRLNPDNFR
ncbi:COP23 domain-containing protein [Altericista sp. CCNU0014]|uniref:COP23 domain-containing protein n=1 Tax=Altericista sp. CCNU0014 TaxID=3082949 RepID=UPI0038507B32